MSQGAFYPPPMQPIYIQSPAYPPMMMQQGMGGHPSSYGPPYHSYSYGYPGAMMGPPLRRAGSINAKIMSQVMNPMVEIKVSHENPNQLRMPNDLSLKRSNTLVLGLIIRALGWMMGLEWGR